MAESDKTAIGVTRGMKREEKLHGAVERSGNTVAWRSKTRKASE